MKTLIPVLLVLAIAGCTTLGPLQGSTVSAGSPVAQIDTTPASLAPSSSDQSLGPRLVIPATGGAPVFGIPLGGDLFLPVTGGAPVIGISP